MCSSRVSAAEAIDRPVLRFRRRQTGPDDRRRGRRTRVRARRSRSAVFRRPAGVLHGTFSYILQDSDGQVVPTHSVSAGLDYPAVGPEHASFTIPGRVNTRALTTTEALDAFHELSRLEGIIPALESAHAIAQAKKLHAPAGQIVLVNLSGRGDKDVTEVMRISRGNGLNDR